MPRAMFECKAYKKVFSSHQALGGQRASHKKVKGCFAAKLESSEPSRHAEAIDRNKDDPNKEEHAHTNNDANISTSEAMAELLMAIMPMESPVVALAAAPLKKKGKMHECFVCHRLFTSRKALGDHKCCHWLMSSLADHGGLESNWECPGGSSRD
ncbi:hypothetical protein E2562_009552 [Oryza meyeriana var. granulata]|uniref:C2H2-type domain-containing protein n=1 Tax=Oryza meyeriana var. granulata TaxID=110450 RepID=A0A6G1F5U5_9ORYZ|nr:hypothetical protein E2562_009552 [Oryza meyeriana var. granulata]